jgi:lysophospholipase L1-like esterase
MRKIILLALVLVIVTSADLFGQFRLASDGFVSQFSNPNDSTYIVDVDLFSDLTGTGYVPTGITTAYRVFSQRGQLYRISATSNLTFSSARLTLVEIDNDQVNTEGLPTGQIQIFDPGAVGAIPQVPFGTTGATSVLQAAVVSYNSIIPSVSAGVSAAQVKVDVDSALVAAKGYADLKEQRDSRGSISQGANMAYKIGVDTFKQPNIWLVGDSKLNAVHTISKIQANYGAAYGFAGTGYMSLSTKNNGRLGLIPRATSSAPVEYPGTVFAKYSLDGQAQELTGTGEVRIELNTNYTTYTDDLTCTYWDYAKISYLRHPSGGNIKIIVDDITLATIDANGAEAKMIYEITGLADTSHTLKIENVSGTNYTLDAYFLRTNAKGIIVNCLSNSGYDAELFNTLLDFPNKEMLSSYPPDAVVVRLGTNDSNRDFTPTAFVANVARIVDTLQNYGPSSDVLLVGIEGMALGTIYTDTEYNAKLKSSADARYWRFANLYDIVPDAATFQSRGFSTDAVHESREGSHLIGNFIFSAIQNNGGASSLPQDLQAATDVGAVTDNPITINANLNLQDANGNIRIGLQAGEDLTTGTFNIMRGYQSALNTTTGGYNVFDGYQVAFRNTTGEKNVVIGGQSFFNNRTGSQNFALGAQAGQFATGSVPLFTANQSMYVGPMTEAAYDNPINENVFGFDAIGNGSNSFTFGNDNTDSTFLKGTVHFNAAPDLNSNYLGGLLDPVSNQQGATKGYVDAQTSAIASQWTTTGSDIYYNTGNVGIGTVTPTTNLHISEPTLNAQLRLDAAQFATFIISSDLSSTSDRDPSFRFETQGVERWRVGVDDSDSDAFVISASVLSSTAAAIFIQKDNKYVGFGTDPTQQIDVAGSIRARGIGTGTPTTGLGTTSNGTFAKTDLFINSAIQTDINNAQTDAEAYASTLANGIQFATQDADSVVTSVNPKVYFTLITTTSASGPTSLVLPPAAAARAGQTISLFSILGPGATEDNRFSTTSGDIRNGTATVSSLVVAVGNVVSVTCRLINTSGTYNWVVN